MILIVCLGAFGFAFLVLWYAFRDAYRSSTWRLDDRPDYDVTNYKRHGFRGED
mgnify:CR=1 FL=1